MVNITSVVGNKGDSREQFYICANNTDGSNVISAAFAPQEQLLVGSPGCGGGQP